jgi:hypothetical protein
MRPGNAEHSISMAFFIINQTCFEHLLGKIADTSFPV